MTPRLAIIIRACLCECLNTPDVTYPRFTGSSKKILPY